MVDGLVVREKGLLVVLPFDQAWLLASQGLLQATVPWSKDPKMVEGIGEPGAGAQLRLPDEKGHDDLVYLPIWDRENAHWVNPFRPDGPSLPGPAPEK